MSDRKKLKILSINRWIGYNEGGNETHTKDLLHWLTIRGHDVSVITTKGDSLKGFKDINVYYIKGPKRYFSYGFSGVFLAFIFIFKSFFKFFNLFLKGERYDLVLVHFSLEAVLARFIKLFFGVPYVMRLAGDTPLELIEGKRADAAIHVSEFMNKQSKKYGYFAHVIPKGFDLDRFNPGLNVDDLKQKYNFGEKDKILLSVCRLDPRKNLITLIEAMNLLVNKRGRDEFFLFIIGDGVERKFLMSKSKMFKLDNNISFLGQINNYDPILAKYYVFSDLFILPTLYEGFGWVFLEAMACGTPVLTTTTGANQEVVGESGALIKPRDPVLLADAIEKLLDTPDLLGEFSRRGLSKARELPWDKQIIKYENVLINASKRDCNSVACKSSVLFYLFLDSLSVIKNLLSGVIFNRTSNKRSVWNIKGQVGGV